MDEINEALIQKEMQKTVGGAISVLEWWHLFTFIDIAIAKDGMFATVEDAKAIEVIAKRLHDQVFPKPKDSKEELAEKLALPKKKLILPQGSDIIV